MSTSPISGRSAACETARGRHSGATMPALHDARFFALPVALARVGALVVLLFPARQANLELCPAVLPVHCKRHDRPTLAFDRPDERVELAPVQEKLARPRRVGPGLRGGSDERRHVGADEPGLAAFQQDVGFLELESARAQRLHFPALERDARLDALLDEE